MNEFALRFIAGGSLITIVSLISKCKYPYISGLFMMFPAVTLVGYYFVSGNVTPLELKSITVFSLVSLVTVAVFIVSFYVFQSKYDVIFALLLSLLCWSASAGVIVFLSRLW